jgi:hypothetical protein
MESRFKCDNEDCPEVDVKVGLPYLEALEHLKTCPINPWNTCKYGCGFEGTREQVEGEHYPVCKEKNGEEKKCSECGFKQVTAEKEHDCVEQLMKSLEEAKKERKELEAVCKPRQLDIWCFKRHRMTEVNGIKSQFFNRKNKLECKRCGLDTLWRKLTYFICLECMQTHDKDILENENAV